MAKKSITCEINKELAAHIARQIVKGLGEFPPDEAASVLNGIQVALMYIAKEIAEHQTENGMVEKLILSWFVSTDQFAGTQYSKYINLEEE